MASIWPVARHPRSRRARHGVARPRRQARSYRGDAVAWRPKTARYRTCTGARSKSAAAGRADRRHGHRRALADDRQGARALGDAEDHRRVHRARHGYRVQDRAKNRCLVLRLHPCVRNARGDPAQRGRDRGLSRHRASRGRAMSAQPVVQVEDLDVYYGTSQILFGVGLSVRQGETMALLGRNGAGKSTTMKAIMGLAPARRGRVMLRGRVVSGLKPHRIAKAGLGFVPEDRQIFPEHTVEDNLVIGQKKGPGGEDDWSVRRVYDVFPLLEPLRNRIAGRLSGGEQQMLAIARTLMGNPALLLLDEPSEGLAPIIVQRIGELLRQLRGTGATVLIAEQNMHFCLGLASHATVIDKGQIVYTSGIEELKANDNIRQRYLAL